MNKKVKSIILAIQKKFNRFDSSVKNPRYLEKPMSNPPIFIIGPPRSGSTLLLQWMIAQFEISYISNLLALFPSQMVKLCRIIPKAANGCQKEISRSEFGYISGLFSPNEAGVIMQKWFEDSTLDIEKKYVRRTIAEISSITDRPVLIKNLNNTIRLNKIISIFPESRFLYLHREIPYTAQSILSVRKKMYGSYEKWWSIQPPGYEKALEFHPFKQVIWQITTIEDICNKFMERYSQRVYKLAYWDFCKSPRKYLHEIRTFFHLNAKSNVSLMKESIIYSKKVQLPDKDWKKLVETYKLLKKTK